MKLPVVLLLMTTSHSPLASVPVTVQSVASTVSGVAPVHVIVGLTPATSEGVPDTVFSTCTVNVWSSPTRFVSSAVT